MEPPPFEVAGAGVDDGFAEDTVEAEASEDFSEPDFSEPDLSDPDLSDPDFWVDPESDPEEEARESLR